MTLTELVQRLCATHSETFTVQGETHTILRRGLLLDLEAAGHASTATRSGSVPGPKLPIDGDALDLAKAIRADLTADLIRLRATKLRFGPLHHIMRAWHDHYQASTPTASEQAVWIEQLEKWETAIRALVEPEKRMPVSGHPCPVCGNTRARDGDDNMIALWIAFHEDAPEATTRLECKACRDVLASGSKAVAATLHIRRNDLIA